MTTTVTAVTYPFTMACWFYCVDNTADNNIPLSLVDQSANQYYFSLSTFTDGEIYLACNGPTAPVTTHSVAYSSATWTPVIAVVHGAASRDLYVGASTANSTVDIGTPTGMDTIVAGTRWNAAGTGPDTAQYFDGKVAWPVLARGEEWDSAARAAYIAGTEAHKISGVTPDLCKSFIQNASTPADYGTAFTLFNTPTITDSPSVLTGQGKKQLTITGTDTELKTVIQTLSYTPDPGYLGSDTLTVLSTDDGARTDSDTMALTVAEAAVPIAAAFIPLSRRRRDR